MKKPDTYNRARIEILNYIINFCTSFWYGETSPYARVDPKHSFRSSFTDDKDLKVGCLVKLQSAPFTKFYLGWLLKIDSKESGFTEYTIQSIEDGSLCRWSNVGICMFSPETVESMPHWKWTDRQFEFYDKWLRVFRRNDAYMTKPLYPTFHEDGSVTLSARPHVFLSAINDQYESPKKTFPNWKKVSVAQMNDFYKEAKEAIENRQKKQLTATP